MKRFDKGYIYSSLLSDFFGSLVILFIFLKDFFLDEEANPSDFVAAIPLFVIGFIVVYLCFFIYRILYYKTSGYELTESEIKCNRGVLFRKRSVLDYRKVHAINKKQSLFHRIFGIAVLTVDSGSTNTSHQAEITIVEKDKVVDDLVNELNVLKAGGDIVVLKHNQNPKYLSYALSTTNAQMQKSKGKVKSKVVHSSVPAIESIIIPVPPLEVQAEIVNILDNFTELTARKQQYEYYSKKF